MVASQDEEADPPLLALVRRVLESEGFLCHRLPGLTVLSTSVSVDDLSWCVFARTLEAEQEVAIYSSSPVEVAPERRQAMSELVTRANFGLVIGNFELDLADGELRFKTSIDVEGDRLSEALVRNLVFANLAVTRRYLPAVLAVSRFGADPAAAVAEVES
jgi:hypothetical protein